MNKVCPDCGLPKELCTCEVAAKEREKIRVYTVQRRYKKFITIIEGISRDIDLKKLIKDMKTELACGGTLRNGTIELQGNHMQRIKKILVRMGFPEEQIEIR